MKSYINLLLGLSLLLVFSSCEEVIILDLSDAEQRIIIEGTLNISTQVAKVVVTKSGSFYDSNELEKVTDAIIYLETNTGIRYDLVENATGDYMANNIPINSGAAYILTVESESEVYTAQTIVPAPALLDSLVVEEFERPFGGNEDTTFQIIAEWEDPANVSNYYRIRTYLNDTLSLREYSLSNDEFNEGENIRTPVRERFEEGEHARIELLSVDKKYYDYFIELSSLSSNGPNSSTPFNPKGNFDNNALGYFGIYSSSSLEVQL